jgi:UDP-N-acetylglucosamine 2-epimerase (non-hydrolysing)
VTNKPKVLFVVGTRPDCIKSVPVYQAFQNSPDFEAILVSTGQHKEMLQQVFDVFQVSPDMDLGLMVPGQSLASMSSRMIAELDRAFGEFQPDYVFAQGDTTTTFIASLAAFYRGIPFGHVEAGLRTHNIRNPFPEEFNRQATSLIAQHHFAPTLESAKNLEREHVPNEAIFVTGNTGIDAVLAVAQAVEQTWYPDHTGPLVLVTMHRRENWGEPMREAAQAILEVTLENPDVKVVVAMHKNPDVRATLTEVFGGCPQVDLIEPPEYMQFVKLMQRSDLILTDSGGVQEEAPSFGKPILVLRETTERPEGLEAGFSVLVGTNREKIMSHYRTFMYDRDRLTARKSTTNPYGDGKASQRILEVLTKHFQNA